MSTAQLGYNSMAEAIRNGDDLGVLLTRLLAKRHTLAGAELVGGSVQCLLDVVRAIQAAGYESSSKDHRVARFLRASHTAKAIDLTHGLNGGDPVATGQQLSALCGAVSNMRHRITVREQPAQSETPSAAAPVTPPGPIEVRVISMPDRLVETGVQYDESGRISKSIQTQTDIKWPAAA